LALAIAMAGRMEGERLPAAVALDEPTRGMDRARKDDLVALIHQLAGRGAFVDPWDTKAPRGAAVVVATHDVEFAAEFADRVVLMGEGTILADGPPAEILAGGWYFATETARVLGGHRGILTAAQAVTALGGARAPLGTAG